MQEILGLGEEEQTGNEKRSSSGVEKFVSGHEDWFQPFPIHIASRMYAWSHNDRTARGVDKER